MGHIKALASDEMEGRGIGEPGLERATDYHARHFKKYRVEPLFGDSYLQPFALLGSKPDPGATLQISSKGGATTLRNGDDFVVGSFRQQCPRISEGELVYAGHLIQAPERGWDDLKGADLKGKILLVEVNEPGNRPGGIFDGEVMTYYGRWTYKFEQASRLGALGILLIHNTRKATYGWEVVKNSWSAEGFVTPDRVPGQCFSGWISEGKAAEVLKRAGIDPTALRASAEQKQFKPVPLNARVNVTHKPTFRTVKVANVGGIVRGVSPDRHVVISAHHDHLGKDATLAGDQIYNGALDNGSASAVMLSLARYFASRGQRPPVSLIFLAPTAEEEGLLGSTYFADHPPVPLSRIMANLNLELTNVWGETADVFAIGATLSSLEEILKTAATNASLRYVAEPPDLDGYFYRSDQISFARAGIPAVWLAEGPTARGADPARIRKARQAFKRTDYHRVTDEVKPDWDLSGAVQIARWIREAVPLLGQADVPPCYHKTSGFVRKPEVTP
jgi:Zn-dependent M28 family amino/carboxypeptidase